MEILMDLLITMILSVVMELSSPGYIVYPVNDIIMDPPRFSDAPNFQLRGNGKNNRRRDSRGFSQDHESRVDVIRTIIEEELASKGIEAKVFFFNGSYIVKLTDKKDTRKLKNSGKRSKRRGKR
jgi:hypothetical protein